jgi:hypothetical protein
LEFWTRWVGPVDPVGVDESSSDHGRVEVDPGYVESTLCQPDCQMARPAADFENACPVRRNQSYIVGDTGEEGTEYQSAHKVVETCIGDQDSAVRLVMVCSNMAVSDGSGGRSNDHS